jgi:large subunit ribosomal protein L6
MSRIGKMPITIPSGVTVTVSEHELTVTGPKGALTQFIIPGISVKQEEGQLVVSQSDDPNNHHGHFGLMRSLIQNMVIGVSQGFSKKLEVTGVGFRVAQQGADLKLNLGFSHDVMYHIPEGVTTALEQNTITISGTNKQQVGQIAAEIRSLKKPEPYKGKGISYVGEHIIRKSGKTGKEK